MEEKNISKVSLAKLSPPRVSNVLLRERLFKKLDDLREYPVIWVSAPGGSGKTVLAASYLQHSERNSIWYQIDESDTDPAAFFDFLETAVSSRQLDKDIVTPKFNEEYRKGIEAFARNFCRSLFQQLGDQGVLVLDNFQNLPEGSPTHKVLKQFIAEIPIGITLLIISRSGPGSDYLRFRANGMIAMLDHQELDLTENETQSFCKQRFSKLSVKESKQLASDLHRSTQGWAAGLVLMLEQDDGQAAIRDVANAQSHDLVFDYFAGEIFQRESDQVKEFLLKTAMLPHFTVDIAEVLTRNIDTRQLLQNLTHRNYFTYRSASIADAYEYHPLFREFLLSRIETFFNALELRKIQEFAADLLNEREWHAEAAVLYCQAKQWKKLSVLVSEQAQALIHKGRYTLLRSWIQSFPLEHLEAMPWMEYWLAMSLQPANTRDSRNYFVRVYEKFSQLDDVTGSLASCCGVIETYVHDQACFSDLDYWIEVLEDLNGQVSAGFDAQLEARISVSMFNALMYRQPDNERMAYWEDRLREIIFRTEDVSSRLGLGSQLLLYYTLWTGEMPKATVLLKVLRQSMSPEELDPLSQVVWYSNEAIYLWKIGENSASIKAVKDGMAVADAYDIHAYDIFIMSSGIYASVATNRMDQAEVYLARMETGLNRSRQVDVVQYHYLAAGLAIVRGELGIAREYAETALEAGIQSGSLYPETMGRLILALCLIRMGKITEVVFHLSRITDMAERINSRALHYLNRLVASEAAFSCNEMERGVNFLKEAFEYERDLGRVYYGFWWNRCLSNNCIQALDNNLEVEFIQQMIRRHELIPEKAPLHLDTWVWPIKIYTLGRFSATLYGQQLAVTAKSSKKPLELLKVLIALGARQVSQDVLIELLWPESEGDAATQSLYTTTHRLRKILSENAVIMEDGRLSLDPRYIWIDSLAFLRCAGSLGDGLVGAKRQDAERIESLSDQMYRLYQGNFLGKDETNPGYVAMREKLRLRFLKLTDTLGHYWLERDQLDKCVDCFEQALAVDPVVEDFYHSLMNAYINSDRQADALLVYQRCRKNMSSILGLSPSKNMVDLYQTIKK